MQKVRVESFGISIDGFGAGPKQTFENPMGIRGTELQNWFFPTLTFQKYVLGKEEGTTGIDNDFAARGFSNIGSSIIGRNMFGPVRGSWPDENWKGWWGDNPPYHTPVYILTKYPRKSIEMEGGTTFHFITEGIHVALEKAKKAANGKDVRIGGGVSVISQYLKAKLIDTIHLVVSPIILGSGENLLNKINLADLGYKCNKYKTSESVMHLIFTK